MADRGVRRGLELMRQWSGGVVDQGLVDNYPLPPHSSVVEVTPQDVQRWLGISLEPDEIADILHRLEFDVETDGRMVRATAPDHRLDIGEGVIGKADLMEEIARIYGYERIPETRMRDELPIQLSNPSLEWEERIRDILASLGLQEVATYRMTSAERESHLVPREAALEEKDQRPYVQLVNPLSLDRNVLRHSLLSSLLEVVERNTRIRQRIALFELGPAFFVSEAGELPDELPRLVIALTGPRALPDWQGADTSPMDFYDLKGIVQVLLEELRVGEARYEPWTHPSFHSGKCARVAVLDNRGIASKHLGVLGELHPLVRRNYDLPETPLLVADFDLQAILELIPERYNVQPVSIYPPVLEDIAIVVDESIPAERVVNLIRQAGGQPVIDIRLFDVYRGDQIEPGKKSLAYSLTYQDPQRTLTDDEVSKIRQRILHHLEQDLGAHLRS
jgi:phenylalanyl-tRNA synthetase beta chain